MNSETSTNQSDIKIHSTEDRKDNGVNPKTTTFQYLFPMKVDRCHFLKRQLSLPKRELLFSDNTVYSLKEICNNLGLL